MGHEHSQGCGTHVTRTWAASQGVCDQAQRVACRLVQIQECFRWLPSPHPWSSPLPLTWELLGILLRLQHSLGLLRTSDSTVTSDRKPWWADFSFFLLLLAGPAAALFPLLTVLLSS